jgi:vacuolar-type H+-ATPase subunit F/Vma7
MSRVVALGPAAKVAGFALAGATVLETDEEGFLGAWQRLPEDTGLLLLTPEAAEALKERLPQRERLLWVQIPD